MTIVRPPAAPEQPDWRKLCLIAPRPPQKTLMRQSAARLPEIVVFRARMTTTGQRKLAADPSAKRRWRVVNSTKRDDEPSSPRFTLSMMNPSKCSVERSFLLRLKSSAVRRKSTLPVQGPRRMTSQSRLPSVLGPTGQRTTCSASRDTSC